MPGSPGKPIPFLQLINQPIKKVSYFFLVGAASEFANPISLSYIKNRVQCISSPLSPSPKKQSPQRRKNPANRTNSTVQDFSTPPACASCLVPASAKRKGLCIFVQLFSRRAQNGWAASRNSIGNSWRSSGTN